MDPVNTHVDAALEQLGDSTHQQMYTMISAEEHAAVLSKMVSFVQEPVGHLPEQDELYLEQQLTDMFGFEVTNELDGNRLPYSHGVMAALPHFKRFPGDTLAQHDVYREAELAKRRSVFGWLSEMGQLTPRAVAREKYGFSLHMFALSGWHEQYRELFEWFKFRKMIMICPTEAKAIVGSVIHEGPTDAMRYQFGGTPEVIRDANVWSMRSNGRVFLFFVNDPKDVVPLGPIQLYKKESDTIRV